MKNFISEQKDFFNTNSTKDINFRIKQLQKLKLILKENEELFNQAINFDFKKSKFETYVTEFSLLFHEINQACKSLKKWSAKKSVATNISNLPGKSYIIPEPLGVCLVMGAWNYPYQLSFGPAIAALAAGNTVILKPSEIPINTSRVMAKIINQNFDSKFFKVIEGGVDETTQLLKEKFDKIFFTGSTAVGKIVYQAAAKNLTPVILELGGKSPTFITESCNLKMSVKRLVWGKFLNSGQTCIAPDYVLVHSSIKNFFLQELKKEIKASCYSVKNQNYVQIINERNFKRLVKLIDEDKLYYGGGSCSKGRVIDPTILTNVTFDDEIMREEIFGPILPVIGYSDIDKEIAEIKKRDKPLACYVFTDNKIEKEKILNEISFGGGGVNDTLAHIANSKLPFGGVGSSGMGSYHGEFGFKAFSHYKGVIEKATWFEANLKYFPYTKGKLSWIRRLME